MICLWKPRNLEPQFVPVLSGFVQCQFRWCCRPFCGFGAVPPHAQGSWLAGVFVVRNVCSGSEAETVITEGASSISSRRPLAKGLARTRDRLVGMQVGPARDGTRIVNPAGQPAHGA